MRVSAKWCATHHLWLTMLIYSWIDSGGVNIRVQLNLKWECLTIRIADRIFPYEFRFVCLVRGFAIFIASLEREATERSEPTAEGLAKFVKTYYFIACALLLHHILPHMSHVSPIFQKEHVDVSLIQPTLDSTMQSI